MNAKAPRVPAQMGQVACEGSRIRFPVPPSLSLSLPVCDEKKSGAPGIEPGAPHACGDVSTHLAMDTTLVYVTKRVTFGVFQ